MFTNKDIIFFKKAKSAANLSDYNKEHIGCIAVYRGKVIGVGYNTNKTKVTNGTGIIKEGYIVVVFENIKSTTASGADYLKYDEVRDPDWNIPAGAKSQLATEKAGKTTIKLPNGKTCTSYSSSDAPVIIYDVSLRANNDYEQTGTH